MAALNKKANSKLVEISRNLVRLRKKLARQKHAVSIEIATQRKLEDDIRAEERILIELNELDVIKKRISPALLRARESISSKAKESKRRDITIEERDALIKQVGLDREKLTSSCKHVLVLRFPGYEGSRSRDYDDGYLGMRMCVMCGFSEEEKDDCRALEKNPTRVIKRADRETFYALKEILFEFDARGLVDLFKEAAGPSDWITVFRGAYME